MELERPSREDIFMRMAQMMSSRSTCERRRVGAAIVDSKSNKILSFGYNGSLKGHPHCDGKCPLVEGHCVRAQHAEVNAIACLSGHYNSLTLYCTDMPCLYCMRLSLQHSVDTIYFTRWYQDEIRDQLFMNEHNKKLKVIQYVPGISLGEASHQEIIFEQGEKHYDRIYTAPNPTDLFTKSRK